MSWWPYLLIVALGYFMVKSWMYRRYAQVLSDALTEQLNRQRLEDELAEAACRDAMIAASEEHLDPYSPDTITDPGHVIIRFPMSEN